MFTLVGLALKKDRSASSPRRRPRLSRVEKRRALKRVVAKRAHRERLAARAEEYWASNGHTRRHAYLLHVRRALRAEGFRSTPLQWRHRGHAFGLVKDLGDKQIHVRVYENGIVDAEVEIHKRYLQHLYSPRPSAHRVVQLIFEKHGIPADLVNVHYVPRVGAWRKHYPAGRTPVSHIFGGVMLAGGIVAASFARFVLKRMKGRAA